MQKQHRHMLCACMLLACLLMAGSAMAADDAAAAAAQEAADATAGPSAGAADAAQADGSASKPMPLDPKNIEKAASAFVYLLSNPYDLGEKLLPSDFSLTKAGLRDEVLQAAEGVRASVRQGLGEVIAQAANKTAEWVAAAQAEVQRAGGLGAAESSKLLQRLSSIPVKFDAQGNTLVSNPLTAIGAFMVNALQQQLKAARQAGGPELSQQLEQSAAGRKLLAEMEAFESEPLDEEEDDVIDLSSTGPRRGPAAVVRQLDRMMNFLVSLADVADDVIAEVDKIHGQADAADGSGAGPAGADDDDSNDDGSDAASRKLQQLLPDPNAGYAKATRLIFSNVFDFFRANGLYGLTPLIADLRGLLTRYNWIADVLNILDAPLENFVNANYIPLPQSNDEFIKLVQKFASDYCKLEKASSSETVLGSFVGPTTSYEVKPVSCPIYTDPATGRNYVSFVDCDAATLVIKTTPLTITEAYFTAAEYAGTECKYSEPFGTDLSLNIGGGEQSFTFTRSAKGIDIIPNVIQINGRGRIHNTVPPAYDADTNLPGSNPPVGNGFFANNFGWSFNGQNPPRVG